MKIFCLDILCQNISIVWRVMPSACPHPLTRAVFKWTKFFLLFFFVSPLCVSSFSLVQTLKEILKQKLIKKKLCWRKYNTSCKKIKSCCFVITIFFFFNLIIYCSFVIKNDFTVQFLSLFFSISLFIFGWLIDFIGKSTHLGLFHAKRLGNYVHCIFTFFI